MYTIKEAASRSGISTALLRAWERRYRIVEPARTPSGYRLYDEISIIRLRAMHRLVEDGWRPSTAAAHILEVGDDGASAILQESEQTASEEEPLGRDGAEDLTAAFVDAARSLDEPGFEAVLDEMFARGSFERVATELLMPALVALGEGWATGQLDVAAEHAAASAVARRLGMAFLAAGRPGSQGDVVLVGLPPGARHELGAMAFATAARRAGVAVRYLGADLPLQEWTDAAAKTSAVAAVIGVVTRADVDPAERVSLALRAARPNLVVAFGGRAAELVHVSDADHELRLPEELAKAVVLLRQGMARAGSEPSPERPDRAPARLAGR